MTGVVATPSGKPALPALPVDSTGTHQATPSVETFELVIALATSRVFCRLAPGSVQAGATPGPGEVTAALPGPAPCFGLQFTVAAGLLLLVVQPAVNKAAVVSMITQLERNSLAGDFICSP